MLQARSNFTASITSTCLALFTLAACLAAALPARASISTPTGLNPGDQFRIIFVSSTARDATTFDLSVYDTFITNLANAAGLTYNGASVTWQALGSTIEIIDDMNYNNIDANSIGRLPASNTSPALYRLDGVKVATNTSDLWDGSILAAINVNELGVGGISANVWTGTDPSGDTSDHGRFWLNDGEGVVIGSSSSTNAGWVDSNDFPQSTNLNRFYGYSQVLTVPSVTAPGVPEPLSLLTWVGLVLIGAGVRRRYRNSPA